MKKEKKKTYCKKYSPLKMLKKITNGTKCFFLIWQKIITQNQAWNHTANVHLATTSLSNELKFLDITYL